MKKYLAMALGLMLMVVLTACGPKSNENTMLFGEDEIGQVNKDNADAYINGQKLDEQAANDLAAAIENMGGNVQGLPAGFPQSVPFYENAQLIDAGEYGDDGYTVVYAVNADYDAVVAFYMQAIAGLDDSGIGNDEAYFESVDMDDGVHINGLTISDADGTTQVFITLTGAENLSDDTSYDETDGDDEWADDPVQISYDSVSGNALEDGYPEDVIPLLSGFKIIDSSKTPDNDLYVLDGIAPAGSFDGAVAFYTQALGSPELFDSQIMSTNTFSGKKDGWSYNVYVAYMKSGGNVMINISIQK